MKLDELKKAKPISKKSSGTDDPDKYIGGWEEYTEPQGINDKRDPKVLASESNMFGSYGATTRVGPVVDAEPEELLISPADKKAIKQSKKAPKKVVRATTKALSAKGKRPVLNPYRLNETVRMPFNGTLNAEYEIVNEAGVVIGVGIVVAGVIDKLDYDTDASQQFRGQIISAILHQIVTDADRNSANLSIEVDGMTSEIKSVFERFGFRGIGGSVMQRNAGASIPTSVNPPQGMSNRDD